MRIETNKQIVLRFFDNISAGNVDAVLALMADNATYWIAGKPDKFSLAGTKTKTEYRELLRWSTTFLPKGIRLTPTGITAEGDRVAVEARGQAQTASGKTYDNLYHFLVEVRDGKIQAVRAYFDTMHVQEVFLDQ